MKRTAVKHSNPNANKTPKVKTGRSNPNGVFKSTSAKTTRITRGNGIGAGRGTGSKGSRNGAAQVASKRM